MTGFSKLITALMVLLSLSASARAAPDTCDLDAFRQYPMREALKVTAARFTASMIYLQFPRDPEAVEAAVDAAWQNEIDAARAKLKPEERPLTMLAAVSGWMHGRDPMITFFLLQPNVFYAEALRTFDETGLAEHAALLREGRALFGPVFGDRKFRYRRWSDGHGTIRDPVLDAQLIALSQRYRQLPDPIDIAADRIAASPALSAMFEPARAAASDQQRLAFLGYGLWNCVNHYGTPEDVSARLAELPEAYRNIAVTFIFEAEMLNGGVEQFFLNSSGTLAPDVVEALAAIGLPKHAAAVQKGIERFPKPYPRQRDTRWAAIQAGGEDFSAALNALTADVDDGELSRAMIRAARAAGILPK